MYDFQRQMTERDQPITGISVAIERQSPLSSAVRAGYYLLLHSFLKPDLSGVRARNELVRVFLLNKEEIRFVAHSEKHQKTVGLVKARRITNSLWGLWDLLVLPKYRGRRIASMLLAAAKRHLKGKGAKKLVSIVSVDNIPSIRHSRRSGWTLLQNRLFICETDISMRRHDIGRIIVRKLQKCDRNELYNLFQFCVGKEWCEYLEIDQGSFLNRIFGPASFEEYGSLSNVVVEKDVYVAQSNGELTGYVISRAPRIFNIACTIHLFVPISEHFGQVCSALLLETFRSSRAERTGKCVITCVGSHEMGDNLEGLGFKVQEFFVQGIRL
jgi:GNAT superfamily N-acetyltransferase